MTPPIAALLAHASRVPVAERHALAAGLRERRAPGTVLLETCHRVELFAPPDATLDAAAAAPAGVLRVDGAEAARHVIALAVGRASAVLAEDQVLHQLREAVASARVEAALPPALDHLLDLALRAGRRARTWLPVESRSLADVALETARGSLAPGSPHEPGLVLVVGAGPMGRLLARAAARRGDRVVVASRTQDRAAALAREVGGVAVPFVPPPDVLAAASVVAVALAGPWPLSDAAAAALERGVARVVDLSAPPSVDGASIARLGSRYTSIDDLAAVPPPAASRALAARLDRLVDETLRAYLEWVDREPEREAARALAARADEAREAELAELWRLIPDLGPGEREHVERMAERLAARLLRDPLERLRRDHDGRHRRAAAELFGL